LPDKKSPLQDHEHDQQWNHRQEKSQLPLYIALAVACLVIAYLLSHLSR
jgi:hypothetical protein